MATIFIGLIFSDYWDDVLCHVDEDCYLSWSSAEQRKREYEELVEKNYGMVLPKLKYGTDDELDKYNDLAKEMEKAKKFLEYRIIERDAKP